MNLDRIITLKDCRSLSMCDWGINYFLKNYGMTSRDVAAGKVTARLLYESNHAMAIKFVEDLEKLHAR